MTSSRLMFRTPRIRMNEFEMDDWMRSSDFLAWHEILFGDSSEVNTSIVNNDKVDMHSPVWFRNT